MSIFNTFKNKTREAQLKKYWEKLKSDLDSRYQAIQVFDKAVSAHAPELLSLLKEKRDYRSSRDSYFEHIRQLQTQLDSFKTVANRQSLTSKKKMQPSEQLPEGSISDRAKNSDKVFQQLTQDMSGLLHSFAKLLLDRNENNESSLPIDELRIALLMDSTNTKNQSEPPSTTELFDKLKTLIENKNLPKPSNDKIIDILAKLKFSPQNTPFVLHALSETIEPPAEPVEARINRIIEEQNSPEVRVEKLIDELSDHALDKFTAFYNTFINHNKNNQAILAEILSRLTMIESHTPGCKALKKLVSEHHNKLQALQSDVINNPTLDNYINLGIKLTKLKNDLETGTYFKSIQKAVHAYQTHLNNNLTQKLIEDTKNFKQLCTLLENSNTHVKIIQEFFTTNYKKTVSASIKWRKYINDYSEQITLSKILKFSEICEKETNATYRPMQIELAEFKFLLTILMGTNSDQRKQFIKINDPREYTSNIENLTSNLFFILNGALKERIPFLHKLKQFFTVEEDPQQASDPFLLFKNEFRQAITEKCLKIIFNPNRSLPETHASLDDSTIEQHLIDFVAPPKTRDLFEATKNAVKALIHCTANLSKKNCPPTLFLKRDESKREAIEELITDLPLNATQDRLEEKFRQWEIKHRDTIDKPRYRASILAQLIEIFHNIQTLFSGKVFATETRALVNRLKEQAFKTRHNLNEVNETLTMRNL